MPFFKSQKQQVIEYLRDQLNESTTTESRLRKKLNDARQEIEKLKQVVRDERDLNAKVGLQLIEKDRKHKRLLKKFGEVGAKIKELRQQCNACSYLTHEYARRNLDLVSQLDEYKKQADNLAEENDRLAQDNAFFEQENKDVWHQYLKARRELEKERCRTCEAIQRRIDKTGYL